MEGKHCSCVQLKGASYICCRTTGGGSGAVTTVTTLAALKTAVTGSTPAIVIVSGTITGNEVVKVGANKSVLGASGACKDLHFDLNILILTSDVPLQPSSVSASASSRSTM